MASAYRFKYDRFGKNLIAFATDLVAVYSTGHMPTKKKKKWEHPQPSDFEKQNCLFLV